MNKPIRLIKIFRYQFTPEKKVLDMYCKQIRRMGTLDNQEVEKFKLLAEHERELYSENEH